MLELINKLLDNGIYLSYAEDNLKVRYDNGTLDQQVLEHLLNEIRANKADLLAYFREHDKGKNIMQIPVASNLLSYPVSSAQQRLWVLSQFEEGSLAYNMPGVFRLSGGLDITIFEQALQRLVERHEALRTVFFHDNAVNHPDGEIRQMIKSEEEIGINLEFDQIKSETKLQEEVQKELQTPFDLGKGPLFRTRLFQVDENDYVFVYVIHHIISDGWSLDVLIAELLGFYQAISAGNTDLLKPLRIQYKDYATWQQNELQNAKMPEHSTYWLKQFEGELPVFQIDSDKQRPALKSYNGGNVQRLMDLETSTKLKSLVNEQGATLFMGLIGLVNAVLYRFTGDEDIIIGTPVTGRDHADLENQIGLYANTLALRTRFSGDDSFNDLLNSVKRITLDAYEHQAYPFDEIVNALNLKRDLSRNPLFDVMVALQNFGLRKPTNETDPGFNISPYGEHGQNTSKFDLAFDFLETAEGLQLSLQFNTDVYQKNLATDIVDRLELILKQAIAHPNKPLNEFCFVSRDEEQTLNTDFNNTKVDFDLKTTLPELFEVQVEKTPNRIAVSFEGKELTYKELNIASNRFADFLRVRHQVEKGHLVGILLERSEWMMVAIMGTLMAGAAYVPLDPSLPQNRIESIKADSECMVVIDQNELETFRSAEEEFTLQNCSIGLQSNDLAYVIYTSGSTGKPKGVLLEHGGVINRLHWMATDLSISQDDIFIQKTPITFDVSVWELFLPLITGSKLVIAKPEGHKDPIYLKQLIIDEAVSIIHFVPSMLIGALESVTWSAMNSLRHVICSGEALSKTAEITFAENASHVKLHNYYGPTEASIDVTAVCLSDTPSTGTEVSIGKPVANTTIRIVNEKNQLQPVGVVGEILIGGVQVARGYLNRLDLNAEKFITNPFNQNQRYYKTGDLAKWTTDGQIIFHGRKDHQVKIRGYRIEPGEVAWAMEQISGVKRAVVKVKEEMLIAYFTETDSAEEVNENDATELKEILKEDLPDYMIPTWFVRLEDMPLTANGKINHRALPQPEGLQMNSGVEYVAPANEMEADITAMIGEILGRNETEIGVKDNFFDLGLNSISLLKLVSRVNRKFNMELGSMTLFEHATVEQLVKHIGSTPDKIEQEKEVEDISESVDEMIDLMEDFE